MLSETLDHFDGLVAELSLLSNELQRDAVRVDAASMTVAPTPALVVSSKPTVCVPPTMRKCPPPLPLSISTSEISEKTLKLDEELRCVLEELKVLTQEECKEEKRTAQVTPADSGCSLSVNSHPENLQVGGRPQSFHSAYSADGSSNFNDSASFLSNESRDVTSFVSSESRDVTSFGLNDSRDHGFTLAPASPIGLEAFRLNEILIKVHSPDDTCKTISISDCTRIFDLLAVLIKKHRVKPTKSWTIREELPELFIERLIEDHVRVFAQIKVWNPASKNKLIFVENFNRFDFVKQDEIKESLLTGVFIPNLEGGLYLRSLGKKSWKKYHFVLRASGLYYSTKKKANKTSDLACLYNLQDVDIFSMIVESDWKEKLKAPTNFSFALRISDSLVRYLCCDSRQTLDVWLLNLRLVKYGRNILDDAERPIVLPSSSFAASPSPSDEALHAGRIPPRSISMNLNFMKPPENEDDKSISNSSLPQSALSSHTPRFDEGDGSLSRRTTYKAIIPLTSNVSRHFSAKSPTVTADIAKSCRRGNIPPPVNLANVRADESDWFNRTPTGDFVRFPSPDFTLTSQSGSYEMLDVAGPTSADSLRCLQHRFSQATSSFNRLQQVTNRPTPPAKTYGDFALLNEIQVTSNRLVHKKSDDKQDIMNAKNQANKLVKQKRVCFDSCVDEIKTEQSLKPANGDRLLKSMSHDSFKSRGLPVVDILNAVSISNNRASNVSTKSPPILPPPPPQRSQDTRLSLRNPDYHLANTNAYLKNSFSGKSKLSELPPPPKELLEGL